ncbi:hypothetical protein FQA39_LY02567 [Lamprigera yunnana]|nr:hypothetical protein FQA39_LY02567 [Lamprigera yunnana]
MSSSESEEPIPEKIKKEDKITSQGDYLHVNQKYKTSYELALNKIKATEITPKKSKSHKFHPVASSTHIGTPMELKLKSKMNRKQNVSSKEITDTSSTSDSEKSDIQKTTKQSRHSDTSSDSSSSSNKYSKKKAKATKRSHEVSSKKVDAELQHRSLKSNDSRRNADDSFFNLSKSKGSKRVSVSHKLSSRENLSDSNNDFAENMNLQSENNDYQKFIEKLVKEKSMYLKNDKLSSSDQGSCSSLERKAKKSKNFKFDNEVKTTDADKSNFKSLVRAKNEKQPLSFKKEDTSASSVDSNSEDFKNKPSSNVGYLSNYKESSIKAPYVRLNKYEKENFLHKVQKRNEFLDKIKSKEEIFLLQVPIKLDPKLLVGVNISLIEEIKISQHKKYESVPICKQQESISLFCNDTNESVHIINPAGYIRIQRRLKKKSVSVMPNISNKPVAFPSNLKERHPFFGPDFRKKIDLEQHIQEKLREVVSSFGEKRKKKHKKKRDASDNPEQQEEIYKFLNETFQSTNTSTSKLLKNETQLNDTVSEQKDDQNKKKKKRKKDKEPQECINSLNDNIEKRKRKKNLKEIEEQDNASFIENAANKVKHRKKRNIELEQDESLNLNKTQKDYSNGNQKEKLKSTADNNDFLIQQLLSSHEGLLYKNKKKKN